MKAEVIHGDCLDVMPTLEAGSVDLILADLPYGTTACKWDAVIPFAPLWENYRRLLKPTGVAVLTASQPFTTALIASNLPWFRYCWVWDKKIAGNPLLAKHQPLKVHEDVCVFAAGPHTYHPEMRTGKMRQKGGGKSKLFNKEWGSYMSDQYYPTSIIEASNAVRGVHPTQKPVDLMEYLVRTYTNPADLVLDNTCGSGTTGVACVNTDRRFIGIEREAAYVEIARKRITEAQNQLTLLPSAA